MQNNKSQVVQTVQDVNSYVPRKCDATNRLITSKDHSSVQIVIADVNEKGVLIETRTTYNFCGFIRAHGEIDDSLNRLATRDGYLNNVWSAAPR